MLIGDLIMIDCGHVCVSSGVRLGFFIRIKKI